MWEYYTEDFATFRADTFPQVRASPRRHFQDALRGQEVYFWKGRNALISETLQEGVKNDIPWPEDDGKALAQNKSAMNKLPDSQSCTATRGYVYNDTSKNISSLSKPYYFQEHRYSGMEKDKLCTRSGCFWKDAIKNFVDPSDGRKTFSFMLTRRPIQIYFDNLQGQRASVGELSRAIRNHFMTKEHVGAHLREWEAITMKSVVAKHNDKKATECLNFLVRRLQYIQSGMTKKY